MAHYISSSDNRYYVALEPSYGAIATVTGQNRIPAVSLSVKQQKEKHERKDKTGGRTFPGLTPNLRARTSFELKTYMTGWSDHSGEPACGPLVTAALGNPGQIWQGGTLQALNSSRELKFSAPHGLSEGQAIVFGGELRFTTAVVDSLTVQINAPFSISPTPGSHLGSTVTYRPGDLLGSVSVFDYWSPTTAVQRIVTGAVVNQMQVKINDDFHRFDFSGPGRHIIDSTTMSAGEGGASTFPDEPTMQDWDYQIIPGHLGQSWMGTTPTQFSTVTGATFTLDNDVDLRAREFGTTLPLAAVPGRRSVKMSLSLFEQDTDATFELYQAAKQGSPIPVMFQLGQQPNQLFGIYLKAVVPEMPHFDDSDRRLQWNFSDCRAQGTLNDEVFLAFG
jgi:hypothetical protein